MNKTTSLSGVTTVSLEDWGIDPNDVTYIDSTITYDSVINTADLELNPDSNVAIGQDGIKITGDADIMIRGVSLAETIDTIQKRLAILHPNPELEKEWDQLKQLADQYRELEKQLIEKQSAWDALKR